MLTQALRPGDLMSEQDECYACSKRAEMVITEQVGGPPRRLRRRRPRDARGLGTKGVQTWMPVFRKVVRRRGHDRLPRRALEPLRSTGKCWMDRAQRPTYYRIGASPDSAETRAELWALCERLAASG